MAILQVLIGFALQSFNRIFMTALGWATILLFGRVPRERQIYLSLIVFGSVIWLVIAIGIAWPRAGVFMLAFAHIPRSVNQAWVRVGMAAAAAVLPLFVGAATLLLRDPRLRPVDAASKWQTVLDGYRFTVGIALTLLVTVVIAPMMLARNLVRRWTAKHFPVVIETADYPEVVVDIQRGLASAGLRTLRASTHPLLRIPTTMLTVFVGDNFDRLVARDLATLVTHELEIVVHPFDLTVSGPRAAVARVQAVLADRLPFTRAYLTWSEEGHHMEDRIDQGWHEMMTGRDDSVSQGASAFRQIERDLETANVEFEEWEILSRILLLMQREVFRAGADAARVAKP
jgi:hypothetical protein